MTSKLTITDERLAELVAFKPLPGTDINSATRDEWMSMAAELQERRKAATDSEPVAEVASMFGDPEAFGEREIKLLVGIQNMPYGTKLYRHAKPAQVVPDIGQIRVGRLPTMNQEEYPGLGDWWVQLRIGEDSNEVLARVYGATPQEANNRAEALACRAAILQAGNSPVIPEGHVMVPKEPTDDMIAAAMNCEDVLFNSDESFCVQFGNIYEAMLAAAPTNIPMNSDVWIPVSERMPENDVSVLTFDGMYKRVHHAMYGHWQCWEPGKITHWMPLPAAPQEVNHG